MKAKILFGLLFISILTTIGLAACDDDNIDDNIDGLWSAMEWTPDMGKDKGIHVISVPVEGGSYEFVCKNYSLWFGVYWVNDEFKEYVADFDIKEEWFTASVKENVLSVTISPNDSGKARSCQIEVTPGDVSDYFVFEQKGQ